MGLNRRYQAEHHRGSRAADDEGRVEYLRRYVVHLAVRGVVQLVVQSFRRDLVICDKSIRATRGGLAGFLQLF